MSTLEPPPNRVEKFTFQWKEWLNKLYQFIQSHTGGSTPTSPATGTSWNAHGNTATGTATSPLKIDAGTFWIEGTTGNVPIEDTAGTRFLWLPYRSAIRAGQLDVAGSANWNDANIGLSSIAMGFNSKASGPGSIAMGENAQATGSASIGLSTGSEAFGTSSLAIGNSCHAHQLVSTAIGYDADATAFPSLAVGANVQATAANASVLGSGQSPFFNPLVNNIANSMMLGVGAITPTLTLRNSRCGVGPTGTNPLSTLDVAGSVGAQYRTLDSGTVIHTGSTTILASENEYTFRIDCSALTGINNYFIINLPSISGIDRRIYYFKAVDISGTAVSSAQIRSQPNTSGTDSIENWPSGNGRVVAANGPLVMNPGDSITIIANNTDSTWWVI